ncbi:MAG: FxLYD domain-containing protein [Minisyncoccia bacterium]
MSWAAKRRATILGGIGTVVLVVLVLIFYPALHSAPSCSDGRQDGSEAGVDCGGSCPYLCQSQVESPVVRFTQAFSPGPGRTDVIAYVDNPNQDASAKDVPYTLTLYGADNVLVAKTSGTLELPPASTVPVFVANLVTGGQPTAQAFLTIDPTAISWQAGADTRTLPVVGSPAIGGSLSAPHVVATLSNPSALPIQNVAVVAAVFDASGNVIDASQTLLPSIPPQGTSVATFTWNEPFSSAPTRVDVIPLVPLP